MRSRRFASAGIAIVLVFAAQRAAAQTAKEPSEAVAEYVAVNAPLVALTNVQVVDGTGAPPLAGATIVIRDGVIEAVGANVDVPAGAEVLDLAGHTVIPGFDAVINRGERIVLVGRNGAGKTTMLKALLSDAPGMPCAPGGR